ncbi:foldase protein PrsA [Paenibacillus sp. FA6]|uniref:foldase protein PrsA n=1 Tax=Paenibacillus sp. FA6 TaxID=3413029 RepID=UPI003F66087E
MLLNKKTWKLVSITLVAVLALSLLSACGKDNKDVVVSYKGGEVTLAEYNVGMNVLTFLSPEYAQLVEMEDFKTYLVNQQVAFKYLSAKASEEAKTKGGQTATDQLAKMKESVGDEIFTQMLEEKKLTEADLKGYLEQVMISMEDMTLKVKDEEVKAQYDATKQDYTVASVRHVLISTTDAEGKERTMEAALKIAKDVKSKLDKGADFATIVKEYSEDPGSVDNGGLYEDTAVGKWVPEFKESALTLPLDTISEPVETSYGYHVMKVESRTETTFEELTQEQKDSIKNLLGSNKIDEFMTKDLPGLIKKVNLPESPKATEEVPTVPENGQDSTGTEEPTTPDASTGKEDAPVTETGK